MKQPGQFFSKWFPRWRHSLRAGEREAFSILTVALGLALCGVLLLVLEGWRSERMQQHRNAEQAGLVKTMESMQNPALSELLVDWLGTYPEPSEDRLEELRALAAQVKTDPSALSGAGATAGTEASGATAGSSHAR